MQQGRLALVPIAFVVRDTDTTSRYASKYRLVDRGAIYCRLDRRERTTFQRCIDPELPKPRCSTGARHYRTHGQGQPTIEAILPWFIDCLGTRQPSSSPTIPRL